MKKKGSPVEMVLPKEGSGYEMEANALTKKGARNPAAKQFLDWAASDEAMALYAKYFAAEGQDSVVPTISTVCQEPGPDPAEWQALRQVR
jgi:iron(III) transport system substrate-binding protein